MSRENPIGIERELIEAITGLDHRIHQTDEALALWQSVPGIEAEIQTLKSQRDEMQGKRCGLAERLSTLQAAPNN